MRPPRSMRPSPDTIAAAEREATPTSMIAEAEAHIAALHGIEQE